MKGTTASCDPSIQTYDSYFPRTYDGDTTTNLISVPALECHHPPVAEVGEGAAGDGVNDGILTAERRVKPKVLEVECGVPGIAGQLQGRNTDTKQTTCIPSHHVTSRHVIGCMLSFIHVVLFMKTHTRTHTTNVCIGTVV